MGCPTHVHPELTRLGGARALRRPGAAADFDPLRAVAAASTLWRRGGGGRPLYDPIYLPEGLHPSTQLPVSARRVAADRAAAEEPGRYQWPFIWHNFIEVFSHPSATNLNKLASVSNKCCYLSARHPITDPGSRGRVPGVRGQRVRLAPWGRGQQDGDVGRRRTGRHLCAGRCGSHSCADVSVQALRLLDLIARSKIMLDAMQEKCTAPTLQGDDKCGERPVLSEATRLEARA